jgi:hypothetical protein
VIAPKAADNHNTCREEIILRQSELATGKPFIHSFWTVLILATGAVAGESIPVPNASGTAPPVCSPEAPAPQGDLPAPLPMVAPVMQPSPLYRLTTILDYRRVGIVSDIPLNQQPNYFNPYRVDMVHPMIRHSYLRRPELRVPQASRLLPY